MNIIEAIISDDPEGLKRLLETDPDIINRFILQCSDRESYEHLAMQNTLYT